MSSTTGPIAPPTCRAESVLFDRITLAIVDIGAVEPSELLARSGNVFWPAELATLNEAGVVEEISLRFYDQTGKQVKTPLDERVIGITLEELAKADRVMALAGGDSKTIAIAGALKLGVIDVLVTDKFTAARLTASASRISLLTEQVIKLLGIDRNMLGWQRLHPLNSKDRLGECGIDLFSGQRDINDEAARGGYINDLKNLGVDRYAGICQVSYDASAR